MKNITKIFPIALPLIKTRFTLNNLTGVICEKEKKIIHMKLSTFTIIELLQPRSKNHI